VELLSYQRRVGDELGQYDGVLHERAGCVGVRAQRVGNLFFALLLHVGRKDAGLLDLQSAVGLHLYLVEDPLQLLQHFDQHCDIGVLQIVVQRVLKDEADAVVSLLEHVDLTILKTLVVLAQRQLLRKQVDVSQHAGHVRLSLWGI